MIYIKRILWLLGYPIMWLLACVLFCAAIFFIGFECMFLYIKNGNIENSGEPLKWVIWLTEKYGDVEPKEKEN